MGIANANANNRKDRTMKKNTTTKRTSIQKRNAAIREVGLRFTRVAEASDIPGNLAELTLWVLRMHKANGDLAWVEDMIAELR